jgi:ribonuclease G
MPSELFVSRIGEQLRTALREDGVTVELRVERAGESGGAGRILKARVTRVIPGMQSAFVDIGLERDAFLHVDDLVLPEEGPTLPEEDGSLDSLADEDETEESEAARAVRLPSPRRSNLRRSAPIEDRLKEGRELLVQVEREALGSKGPRVTCFTTLPGRYLVYMPWIGHRGVSRKIQDPEERYRLRAILATLPGAPGGFIVRTAGLGASEDVLRADATMLVACWAAVLARADGTPAPGVVHTDLDLLLRLLRDAPREGLDRVVVDDPEDHRRALEYLGRLDPQLAARVELHSGPDALFEALGLDLELERALRAKVWLKSGGTLVIEPTEALVSIDVNSGKYLGKRHPEETALRTNLEAAREIARQLRLRDLGGIIVVDFIDMDRPESRRQVIEALETALRQDRARTKIVGLSELGLLQLTRKRTRPGIAAAMTRPCPLCGGQGRVKSRETVAAEVVAELHRLLPDLDGKEVTLRVHPDVAPQVRVVLQSAPAARGRAGIERVRIEEDAALRPDRFDLLA